LKVGSLLHATEFFSSRPEAKAASVDPVDRADQAVWAAKVVAGLCIAAEAAGVRMVRMELLVILGQMAIPGWSVKSSNEMSAYEKRPRAPDLCRGSAEVCNFQKCKCQKPRRMSRLFRNARVSMGAENR
jgi:hypothetical protein